MKGLRIDPLRVTKLLLIVAVIAAAGTFLTRDSEKALAAHTSVYFTLSTSSPAPVTPISMYPGAPPKLLHVWASNVDDPHGLGAYSVVVKYDPLSMSVGYIEKYTAWLDDTLRSPICNPDVIEPVPGDPVLWQAKVECFTITQPPPYGVQGSGKIAEFTVLPGSGPGGFKPMANVTVLTDPGSIQPNPNPPPPDIVVEPQIIPANEISPQVRTTKCADVNPFPNGNGSVSASDFFAVLAKFGTVLGGPGWNEIFDLDANNAVASGDVFIAIGQFGVAC